LISRSENKLSQQTVNTSYTGTRYYVSLTQSLIDYSKYLDWQRSKEVEDQLMLELDEARHTLIFKVVERYFGALDAEDQLQMITAEKELTANELIQIKHQFEKQLVNITDVYEMEARLDQLIADEVEADSNLLVAKQELQELTGMQPGTLAKLRDNLEYKELEGKLDDWLTIAKSENPLLKAKHIAIAAADDNVTSQKAKHLPVVDLQLNYYNTNTGYQNTQTSQYQVQTAAINVTVPIFSGGITSNQVSEAQSKLKLSKEELEAAERGLSKEASEAFTQSNAKTRRIKASLKALSSANKSMEAMQIGLQQGTESMGDLLRAQQLEFKAKRELAKIRYEYLVTRMRFLKAIGTISEQNLEEINNWLVKP
jgi:outer membrane protein